MVQFDWKFALFSKVAHLAMMSTHCFCCVANKKSYFYNNYFYKEEKSDQIQIIFFSFFDPIKYLNKSFYFFSFTLSSFCIFSSRIFTPTFTVILCVCLFSGYMSMQSVQFLSTNTYTYPGYFCCQFIYLARPVNRLQFSLHKHTISFSYHPEQVGEGRNK